MANETMLKGLVFNIPEDQGFVGAAADQGGLFGMPDKAGDAVEVAVEGGDRASGG